MSVKKPPSVNENHSGVPNWTLLGLVTIAAIAIVAVVAMMRPDAVKVNGGEKGPEIKIEKR